MTRDEAIKVVKVIAEADGGCCVCVGHLLDDFVKVFPEHAGLTEKSERDWAHRRPISELRAGPGLNP